MMAIRRNYFAYWWMMFVAVGVVSLPKAYANDAARSEFSRLAEDLETNSLSKIQIISFSHAIATSVTVTPHIFDEMAASTTTSSMVMSQCDLRISGGINFALAHLFYRAAAQISESIPRDVYWRVQFYDAYNLIKYEIYLGRTYANADDVWVRINSIPANTAKFLTEWFETHVDLKGCVISP
jgi:hypothetical protein